MLLTPHILVGVAIITKVQNPIWGLLLVFLSHYFLDAFPQKEYSVANIRERRWRKSLPDFLRVFSDIILGLVIVSLITDYHLFTFIAVFLSILPDGSTLLHTIFPHNKLLAKHQAWHFNINAICQNKKIPVIWGIISQVAISVLAIFFLL